MSASWGTKVRYTLFGESHGVAIGVVIDGLPPGITFNWAEIEREMMRRAPGGALATARKEADKVEVQSGLYNGKTTGAPLCAIIVNSNQRSSDYDLEIPVFRPSHGDYGGWVRFEGCNDPRGGGPFSGRLTAPLTFAGAIAKQLLQAEGIHIGAHLQQIGKIQESRFTIEDCTEETLNKLNRQPLPLLDASLQESMKQAILDAKVEGDSIGGQIEVAAVGVPAGKGDLFFGSVESRLGQVLFAIPAVKGVEFGLGFGITGLKGSQANDSWCKDNEQIRTKTNHNGGLLGGLTTGMPLVCRVAIKPTSSIFLPQETVNAAGETCVLELRGRHDPCIVPRALPVVEAALAIVLWDIL